MKRRSLARPLLRIAPLAALAASLAAPSPASADPEPAGPPRSFHDGDRLVEVVLAGETAKDASGLTPVRLRHAGAPREVPAFVDRTAIVRIDPGSEAELEALGAKVVRVLMPSIGLVLVEDTTGGDGVDLSRRLQPDLPRTSGIRKATPNLYLRRKLHADFVPDDPRLPGQWYFENLEMTTAWGIWKGDPSTSVVVIDSGCDLTHPDLKDKLDEGLDPLDGDTDPTPDVTLPSAAHGTAAAGLVAASTDNGVGIAGGCPECRMRCVRLIEDKPVPIAADVEAFQFALATGAAAVSNSWGFADETPVPSLLADAIENVFDNGRGGLGTMVLFAMGNDNREVADNELQAVRGVLAIGAINNFDDKTPFTNSGNCTDLVAPTGTLSTDIAGSMGYDPGDYTTLFGGTSSACPVAAGIAALVASAGPQLTAQEIYDILIQTAKPAPYAVPDETGHDPVFGFGIINPVAALETVLPPAAGGAGGTGGGGGAGGAGTGGTGGAGGATEIDPSEGCQCGVVGSGDGQSPGAGWPRALVYALGLALALSRRRRR